MRNKCGIATVFNPQYEDFMATLEARGLRLYRSKPSTTGGDHEWGAAFHIGATMICYPTLVCKEKLNSLSCRS